jgi:probable F420-dependent oxidoreductase
MKVDVAVAGPELRQISSLARLAEDIGFDGLHTAEVRHDPFLPLARAAEHTTRLRLGTSVAVSAARSPVNLAHIANDLQEYSRGRFVLALGPPTRMRDAVQALRAIWRTWDEGEGLAFLGEHYRHTASSSFFRPPPHPYGPPGIHLTGTGPRTAQLAGEIADGLVLNGYAGERHLRETTVPALERGLRRSGRDWEDIEVVAPPYTVTGRDSAEDVADLLVHRYGALCRRVTLMGPFHQDPGGWAELVARIHEITCEPVPS